MLNREDLVDRDAERYAQACVMQGLPFERAVEILKGSWIAILSEEARRLERVKTPL